MTHIQILALPDLEQGLEQGHIPAEYPNHQDMGPQNSHSWLPLCAEHAYHIGPGRRCRAGKQLASESCQGLTMSLGFEQQVSCGVVSVLRWLNT